MVDRDPITSVTRKVAKSGSVEYADPLMLNETSRSRLRAIPFFIPHTDHSELSLKVEGFRKVDQGWEKTPRNTFTISEPGCRRLLELLQTHLPVAEQQERGKFLLVPVNEGGVDLAGHSPTDVAQALARVLAQKGIIEHFAQVELSEELTGALRTSIRVGEMRAAVAQLRSHLDEGVTREQIYQDWCERHCWAFGNAYVMRDEVRVISAGDKLDLLLPTVIAGYRDLVELKRPDMPVLQEDDDHNNYYFAAAVSKALGQCHRYLDTLHREAERGLRDHEEIVAYHPRATVVIGRSNTWGKEQQRALHGLNQRLVGISVMTYDHLLAQGERLLSMVDAARSEEITPPNMTYDDDDIPF